ncbi:MAG: hypothetical protein OXC62_15915 [Aestuariivita sp.]|nr:hypothetical protein [Aestuariivita sp.]
MHNLSADRKFELPNIEKRRRTREQVIREKISFVKGTVKNPPSDEEIREMIYEMDGYPEQDSSE